MTYPISSLGELIGEPARTTILISLLDGNSLPAGELARLAGISAQSASAHLSKLVDGGLLAPQNDGRHRYYKITSPEVVHALEALGALRPCRVQLPRSAPARTTTYPRPAHATTTSPVTWP